jgi:replicative DNA helicase
MNSGMELRTGWAAVDALTGGLARGELVILGGRPGTAKTTLALGAAAHMAGACRLQAAIFSLEMPEAQAVQRILALEAGVPPDALRTGCLTDEAAGRVAAAAKRMGDWRLHIDDTGGIEIDVLVARCRSFTGPLDLVVVDYLQLMSGDGHCGSRAREMEAVCAGLRDLARATGAAVLVTSQLSRTLELREDQRPRLDDLRESPAMAAIPDVVLFLQRIDVDPPGLLVHLAKHPRRPLGQRELPEGMHGNGTRADSETAPGETTAPSTQTNAETSQASVANRETGAPA